LIFAFSPLVYVDEFPSRGVRSFAQMTGHQITLYVIGSVLAYVAQVLLVHLALIFPRQRPVLERGPHVLRWLYLAPLLQFVGFPAFATLALPARPVHIVLTALWLSAAVTLAYLVKRRHSEGWKRAFGTRPVMVLGAIVLLIVAGIDTLLTLLPSEATRQTIGWVFGGIAFGVIGVALVVIYSIIACISLYRSYRDSGVEEREQVRWPLWGTIVSLSGILLLIGLAVLLRSLGLHRFLPLIVVEMVEKTCYILTPLSFAFAILKYRLMEIDIVIRKTVTYSIVSGSVLALYLSLAGGLGGFLVTRVGLQSTWITVGATLAAVAVFVPVRNKVQAIVDGRFFRRKEDLPYSLRTLNAKTA
jgi:hypothetical protein